jgi:hypothetical protein
MPYTHGHAVVNVWILGRWPLPANDRRLWLPILLGGMIPDLPLLVFILMEVPQHGGDVAFDELYFQQPWQDVFGYFHSIPLTLFATIVLVGVAVMVYARDAAEEESSAQKVLAMTMTYLRREMTGATEKTTARESTILAPAAETDLEQQERSASSQQVPPPSTNATNVVQQERVEADAAQLPSAAHAASAAIFWSQAAWLAAASSFLHALADLGLHTSDAHSQFLPFSRFKLHSKISYYEVTEYAWIWAPVEFILVLMACRFMWSNLARRWCRILVYLVVASYVLLLAGTCISAISLVT